MTPSASTGRDRLQKALFDLGRPADRSRRSPARHASAAPASPEPGAKPEKPEAEPEKPGASTPSAAEPERFVELTERLERIERKLSDLAEPADGTPDKFRQWIAEGHWERIRFNEFLRLKR